MIQSQEKKHLWKYHDCLVNVLIKFKFTKTVGLYKVTGSTLFSLFESKHQQGLWRAAGSSLR